MRLYFSPGACSLSPHIVLLEAGLPFAIDKVDLRTKLSSGGRDFRSINDKACVPAATGAGRGYGRALPDGRLAQLHRDRTA